MTFLNSIFYIFPRGKTDDFEPKKICDFPLGLFEFCGNYQKLGGATVAHLLSVCFGVCHCQPVSPQSNIF
jgi:hypothetical protein